MGLASSESLENLDENNEIEELEITEVDEALLRNLLEESMNEETRADEVTYAVHSLDVSNGSIAKINELQFQELDWRETMEIALPMDEVMVWYIDDLVGMVDFTSNGDYSQFYSGVLSDETTYCCLWQE